MGETTAGRELRPDAGPSASPAVDASAGSPAATVAQAGAATASRATPPTFATAFDVAYLTNQADVSELILIRHGEQQRVPAGARYAEGVDPPLTERGAAQARLVGERFANERVDAVFASRLTRARETGAEVARHHGLELELDDDLREIELFRDLPPDQSPLDVLGRRALTGMRTRMMRDKRWDVYACSETSAEFRKRTVNAIEGIVAEHAGRRVVIACHGGVINAYLGWILGLPEDMWFRPAHTSVQLVRAKEQTRVIEFLGDTHHLVGPAMDLRSW